MIAWNQTDLTDFFHSSQVKLCIKWVFTIFLSLQLTKITTERNLVYPVAYTIARGLSIPKAFIPDIQTNADINLVCPALDRDRQTETDRQ